MYVIFPVFFSIFRISHIFWHFYVAGCQIKTGDISFSRFRSQCSNIGIGCYSKTVSKSFKFTIMVHISYFLTLSVIISLVFIVIVIVIVIVIRGSASSTTS